MKTVNLDYFKRPFVADPHRVAIWDGWRGLAIASVLVGHFIDIQVWREERLGVDIFFVLSGMLISTILFTKQISLKDFYIRRFSRIYPAYLVFVLAMYLVGAVFSLDFSFTEIFSNLAFLRTYFPADPHIWDTEVAVGHLWSLNVEEHAYVLMSVVTLIAVLRKHVAWLFISLSLMAMAWGTYKYTQMPEAEFELFVIRTESAIAFILFSAGYNLLRRQHNWSLPSWVPLVTLVAAVFCYYRIFPLWVINTCSPILLALTVNHLQDLGPLFQRMLAFAPLRMLGIWSYSIYLWQQFFYIYAWKLPGGKAVGMALAIIVGVGSFYLLENPVRNWINRTFSGKT